MCTGGVQCYNGGECPLPGTSGGCRCPPDYRGLQCHIKVEGYTACASSSNDHYCLNNGSCVSSGGDGSASCECTGNFAGEHCEKPVTLCDESHALEHCENGGTCEVGTATCTCIDGYYGTHCENFGKPDQAGTPKKYSNTDIAIAFTVVSLVLLVAIIGTICCVKRRQKRRNVLSTGKVGENNQTPLPGAYVYENGAQLDYRNKGEIEMGNARTSKGVVLQAQNAEQLGDLPAGYSIPESSMAAVEQNPVNAALALIKKDEEEERSKQAQK